MGLGIKTKLTGWVDWVLTRRCPPIRRLVWNDTTQYGEFLSLVKLLGKTDEGMVVEVGANDGCYCSNSYPFIHRGWRAILLEPNPAVFQKLRELYTSNPRVQCFRLACGAEDACLPLHLGKGDSGYATLSDEKSWWYEATRSEETVPVEVKPLRSILDAASCPKDFDFLSVDTEGFDYQVLVGLDLDIYRPRVIVTEDEKPPYTHAEDKDRLLRRHGYRLAKHIQSNAIWVRTE